MSKQNSSYLYGSNPHIKWVILAISAVISAASIYYTDSLVNKLKEREKKIIEIYARTLEFTIDDEMDGKLLFLARDIIINNNEIPLILLNSKDEIENYRNIQINDNWTEDKKHQKLQEELEEMKREYEPILIMDRDNKGEVLNFWFVYYKNSFLLTQLTYYPIVQLTIIGIFGFIAAVIIWGIIKNH